MCCGELVFAAHLRSVLYMLDISVPSVAWAVLRHGPSCGPEVVRFTSWLVDA